MTAAGDASRMPHAQNMRLEARMVDVILDPKRWASADADAEALLESWLVDEGDCVEAGQVLARASLVHQGLEVAAPSAGIVEQIAVSAGEKFGPGYILVRLADA
jgi:biotin carboxyl carrier protein